MVTQSDIDAYWNDTVERFFEIICYLHYGPEATEYDDC